MRQIPKIVLIHSGTYYNVSKDEYGNDTITASAPLSAIRCEPVKSSALKALGEMKDDVLTLYFDCVNSSPKGQTFSKYDKITFNGQSYEIRDVKDFSPHHYEVALK